MDEMRADMGGGACVLASIYTAARLKLPINIKGNVSLNVQARDAFMFFHLNFAKWGRNFCTNINRGHIFTGRFHSTD